MTIHVVIPVHNRISLTKKCVQALKKQEYSNFKIYIVDDGSTDGTEAWVCANLGQHCLLKGDGNLWWTGSIRYAIEIILHNSKKNDYVLTLNNDVILDANVLNELVYNCTKYDRKCLSNALSVDINTNRIVSSGSSIKSWFFNITHHPYHGKYLADLKSTDVLSVDMLTGRSVLYPIEIFNKIGNFNSKKFPHYAGDSEFTLRAKRAGYELFIVPKALAYLNSESTGLNSMVVRLTLWQSIKSLFSKRSSNNLFVRTIFAISQPPLYARPTFLFVTYLKIFSQALFGNIFLRMRN